MLATRWLPHPGEPNPGDLLKTIDGGKLRRFHFDSLTQRASDLRRPFAKHVWIPLL